LDQYKAHLNKLEDAGFIKDYEDRSTETGFDFTVTCARSTTSLDLDELYKKFKLINRDTENFTVWSPEGVLKKYSCAEDIVEVFVPWRLEMMERRRLHIIADLSEQVRLQSEIVRFINFYLANPQLFKNSGKQALIDTLLKADFVDYERLLAMPIWNLTKDKIEELEQKLVELKKQLAKMEDDTAVDMYRRELKALSF
jgi:DNA gyrase/topoisomerase IV subunit A